MVRELLSPSTNLVLFSPLSHDICGSSTIVVARESKRNLLCYFYQNFCNLYIFRSLAFVVCISIICDIFVSALGGRLVRDVFLHKGPTANWALCLFSTLCQVFWQALIMKTLVFASRASWFSHHVSDAYTRKTDCAFKLALGASVSIFFIILSLESILWIYIAGSWPIVYIAFEMILNEISTSPSSFLFCFTPQPCSAISSLLPFFVIATTTDRQSNRSQN